MVALIIAAIVPGDRNVTSRRVERDSRIELTGRADVIIHAHGITPSHALIVGVTELNVGVVALLRLFRRVDEIETAIVRTTRAVPGEASFDINRAAGLRGDVIKAAHIRGNN